MPETKLPDVAEQSPAAAPAVGGKVLAGKIVGSSLALSLIILLCKFGGYVEKVFLGTAFGTLGWGGHSATMYLALAVFVTLVYDILRYSVIPALLPTLQEVESTEGQSAAWRLASSTFNLIAPLVVAFVLLMVLWPTPLAKLVNQQVVRKSSLDAAQVRNLLEPYRQTAEEEQAQKGAVSEDLSQFLAQSGTLLNGSPAERLAAAESLRQLRDPATLPVLDYAASSDADVAVRAAAAATAGHIRQDSFTLACRLVRIMFIGALFLLAGAITYSILNSQKKFVAPALGDFAFKMATVVPLLAIAVLLTLKAASRAAIVNNAMLVQGIAVFCGSLGLMLIQLWPLRKQLHHYRFRMELTPAVRKVIGLALAPLIYAIFFWGFRRVTDIYFAFQSAGNAYMGLEFSYRLMEAPFRFAIEPLAYVIFPYLAALYVAKDHGGYVRTLMSSLRGLMLLLLPVALCLFVLREQVVRLLFDWGQFGEAGVKLVTLPLGWYALGMIALGLDLVLTRAYFGREDVKTPTILEVLAWVIQIGLILAMRNTALSHGAIALAFTVSRSVKALLLFVGLRWRVGQLDMRNNLVYLVRIAPAVAAMVVAAVLVRSLLGAHFDMTSKQAVVLTLGGAGVAGGLAYLVGLIVCRVPELSQLLDMLKNRKKA